MLKTPVLSPQFWRTDLRGTLLFVSTQLVDQDSSPDQCELLFYLELIYNNLYHANQTFSQEKITTSLL